MKIKTLDIYGYGKWVNQRFDLSETIQVFYGRNEAGKSTLQSFIRSILFGFPSGRQRINKKNQYKPRHSDLYGGRILLTETSKGDLWVERTQKGLKLTTVEGESLAADNLSEILGGLDEKLFDSFYLFTLGNLQEIGQVDAEKLNDYFLSIGTLGSDRFLSLAKRFDKEADTLYGPQAKVRPLNKELLQYEDQAESLEKLEAQLSDYNRLVEERNDLRAQVEKTQKDIASMELQLRKKNQLADRYQNYQEMLALKKEKAQLTWTDMPDQAEETLKDKRADNRRITEEVIQLETTNSHLLTDKKDLHSLEWALDHEADRKQWQHATEIAKSNQRQIEQLAERIDDYQTEMARHAKQGKFNPLRRIKQEDYNRQLEGGVELEAERLTQEEQLKQVNLEHQMVFQQRQDQQSHSASVRQQAGQLETRRMNWETDLLDQESNRQYYLGFALMGMGILYLILLATSVIEAAAFHWFLAILLLGGSIGLNAYILMKHRQAVAAYQADPIHDQIKELRQKEKVYRDQADQYSVHLNELEAEIQDLEAKIQAIRKDQADWLEELGHLPTADPSYILNNNPVQVFFETMAERNELLIQKKNLEDLVDQWQIDIQPMLDYFKPSQSDVHSLFKHMVQAEDILANQVQRGQALDKRLAENQARISKLQEQRRKNDAVIDELFKQTGSKNMDEFKQKLAINQDIQQLDERIKLYEVHLSAYQVTLASIKNAEVLAEDIDYLESRLAALRQGLQPQQSQLANLEVEVLNLEEDGSYIDQLQRLENTQAEIEDLMRQWGVKKLAVELIYQTLRQGLDNPVPEMHERATDLFTEITGGRYEQIRLNKTGLKVLHQSNVLFEVHELSQGTLEQLYVALRLAFVECAQSMVKLPIVIDDAFVNFDEVRKERMYQVLKSYSGQLQILFFTFDPLALELFDEQMIQDLNASTMTKKEPSK